MDRKQFEEYLLLYGANMNEWPEKVRQSGLEAVERSSELRALQKDHVNFERLLKARKYEEPTKDFSQRIISVSSLQKQKKPFSIKSLIAGLIDEFHMPRPALAVISFAMLLALTIGFTIGFTNPNGSSVLNNTEETQLQVFLFDEGDVI